MKNMTLVQHFSELRRRILWCAMVFFAAFVGGWYLAPCLQKFLVMPLMNVWNEGVLLYTGLSDGLMINLSLAALFALIVVVPVLLWHVWAFVVPGLKKQESNFVWPILILSPILFVVGSLFAFYVMLPIVFQFFIELNKGASVPSLMLPVARDYLSFALKMMRVFGIAFQLPLVMVLLNRIGVLGRERVVRFRRYAIVAIVVVAAVLTPPDVVSQVLLAIPMWLLFEFSILFMRRD